MILIASLAIVAFGICFYSYTIERKLKIIPTYKPFCDISDAASCVKPLQSKYATIVGISNSLVGMLFYGLVFILALLHAVKLLFVAVVGGALVSCGLAYIVYFKIRTFCLLCTALYIINFSMLIIMIHARWI